MPKTPKAPNVITEIRGFQILHNPRSPRFVSTLAAPKYLLNGHHPPDPKQYEARCVGCGCTDRSPCRSDTMEHWLFVDRTPEHACGLCTVCGEQDRFVELASFILARRDETRESQRHRASATIQAVLLAERNRTEKFRGTDWHPDDETEDGFATPIVQAPSRKVSPKAVRRAKRR